VIEFVPAEGFGRVVLTNQFPNDAVKGEPFDTGYDDPGRPHEPTGDGYRYRAEIRSRRGIASNKETEVNRLMSNLSIWFHGGSSANSINTILSMPSTGSLMPLLAPNAVGSLPALSELRGFFTDASGNLYVVNAYKDFSSIVTFSPPANSGAPYTFSQILAGGLADGLAHPLCAVLAPAPDGHVYGKGSRNELYL
jgi:hypothetical protein